MKNKLLICVLVLLSGKLFAQNNNSPYSIIGIGDIEKSFFDRTSGMGHAGVALSGSKSLYNINPASFSSLEDYFFHIETAIRYKGVNYSGKPITSTTDNSSSDMVSKKLVFAIKVKPRWGLSFGLMPYSTANYSFNAQKTVQGTNFSTPAYYQGSGGLNQAYIANAYRIAKGLSIGIQASYLFGQMQQEETINSSVSNGSLYTKRIMAINKPFFTGGIQYQNNITNKWKLAIGATASNKTNLNADYSLLVQDAGQTIENNNSYKTGYFQLPVMYTTGLAATYKDKLTFALDYNYQNWSSTNYTGVNYSLVNSDRISAGFEYSAKKSYRDVKYEKGFLQAGVFYSNSYLKMYGQQLNDYGFTLGGGIHSVRNGLGIQGALEVGKRGTTDNGLIKENYTQFTITLLYRDFWFVKGRKYD